jgi:hypothetical protein
MSLGGGFGIYKGGGNGGGGGSSVASKHYRLKTTDTQNLNTVAPVLIDFDVEDLNESNTVFEKVPNGVRLLKEVAIKFKIWLTIEEVSGNNSRLQVTPQVLLNGSPAGVQGYTMYLRDSTNHLTSVGYCEYYLPSVLANTILTVRTIKTSGANGGTAQLDLSNTYFFIESFNPVETDIPVIIAPTPSETVEFDLSIAGSYQCFATNSPIAWQLTPVVSGISIDSTGKITYDGTTPVGTYNFDVTAFNGAGKSAGINFDIEIVVDVPVDPVIYLDGADFNGVPDGTSVSLWSDSSANGNDFQQLNALNQPVTDLDSFGIGNSAVRFNGSTDFLETVSANTNDIFGASPNEGEVWMVVRQNSKVGAAFIIDFPRNGGTNNNATFFNISFDTQLQTTGGIPNNFNQLSARCRQSTGNNYSAVNEDNEIFTATDYLIRAVFGAGQVALYKDGVFIGNGTLTSASYDGSTGAFKPDIGKRANVSFNFASIDIGLILVYNRDLSSAEAISLQELIKDRFPTINIP